MNAVIRPARAGADETAAAADAWRSALALHPAMAAIEAPLKRMSGTLARRFREDVIARKAFLEAEPLARTLLADFLFDRFRADPAGRRFAGQLLEAGRLDALAAFVAAMKVLGPDAFEEVRVDVLARHGLAMDGSQLATLLAPIPPDAATVRAHRAAAATAHLSLAPVEARPDTLFKGQAAAGAVRSGRVHGRAPAVPAYGATWRRAPPARPAAGREPIFERVSEPAPRFDRFCAWLLDLVPFALVAVLGLWSGQVQIVGDEVVAGAAALPIGLAVAAIVLVQAVLTARFGLSIGKLVVGIRIVRLGTQEPPGFVRGVLVRGLAFSVAYAVPPVWLLDHGPIFLAHRRALHDRLAGTEVVRRT